MVESTRPCILFVGPSQSGKHTLASRIISSTVESNTTSCCWLIDTDYYSAETEIHVKRLEDAASDAVQSSEAVVLVFDSSNEESWKQTRDWAAGKNLESAEITLCVANKFDRRATDAQWLADVEDWCLCNHFELVKTSATNVEFDKAIFEDDMAQGVSRLVAALQAHVWPGLTMKERQLLSGNAPSTAANGTHSEESAAKPVTQIRDLDDSESDLEDTEEEQQVQDMEKLFFEVMHMRDRIQHLSDEGRRDAAARMALQIADMLGLDEEDNSDAEL